MSSQDRGSAAAHCGEILSLDVLLHDVDQVTFLLDLIDRDQRRVFQLGCRARLVQEELALLVGLEQLGSRDFECHQSIQPRIVREIHHSKTAPTQTTSNLNRPICVGVRLLFFVRSGSFNSWDSARQISLPATFVQRQCCIDHGFVTRKPLVVRLHVQRLTRLPASQIEFHYEQLFEQTQSPDRRDSIKVVLDAWRLARLPRRLKLVAETVDLLLDLQWQLVAVGSGDRRS